MTETLSSSPTNPQPWMIHLDAPHIFWLLFAILGPPLIWRPIRGMINRWRLQKRREKYPHIVELPKKSKPAPKRSLFSAKNVFGVLQHWILPPLQGLFSACSCLMVQPTIVVVFSLAALLRALFSSSVDLAKRGWTFMEAQRAAWNAPPKEPLPPSLLRKPKWERVKEAQDKNQPLQTNSVQFTNHSTGEIKTQQYYYDPYAEPGDRVTVEPSETPPRENPRQDPVEDIIEDPEEIGRRLSERSKIKQRIQTPPPKRRQRPVTATAHGVGKENSDGAATQNVTTPTVVQGKGKQPFMMRQQSFMDASSPDEAGAKSTSTFMNANAGATPLRAPRAAQTTNNKTPQHFMHSSRKQPLSAQVRKRRSAGETLFSHSPQETSKSSPGSTQQHQTKRRRILTVAPSNSRKRQILLPPVRRNNKREREEQILQEFNRKREKPAPVEPAPTSTPTATRSIPTVPIVFGKGLNGVATGGDASAAPTTEQQVGAPFVFGGGATTPVPAATQPPVSANADGKPTFVFGAGTNAGATTAAGTTNAAQTPAAEPKQGFSFRATPAASTAAPAFVATTTPTTPGIVFGAKQAADAPASTGVGTPATSGDSIFAVGGATSTAAPAQGFAVGANSNAAAAGTTTPAPGFAFGTSTPATKPDPPAANASGQAQASYMFGSTASSTPQSGAAAPAFTPDPNSHGGSGFLSPPTAAQNYNAGATPGFQAPPAVGGAPAAGMNFGAGAAAHFASPAMGGASPVFVPLSSGGASARRREKTKRASKGRR